MGYQSTSLDENWSAATSSWVNYQSSLSAYNAANQITSFTGMVYDTAAHAWKNGQQFFIYYNSGGQIIAESFQTGSGSTWTYTDSLSNTSVNAAGSPLTQLEFSWSGGWRPAYRYTDVYVAPNNLSTSLAESWNGTAFVNYSRAFTFYNSFNQRTLTYNQSWNGTAWVANTLNDIQRFYYETFSVGIPGLSAQAEVQPVIYPVPARQSLGIAACWSLPGHYTGTICDASGKVCLHWEGEASGLYTKEIPVESWSDGVYYLSLAGKQAHWTKSFVVQH